MAFAYPDFDVTWLQHKANRLFCCTAKACPKVLSECQNEWEAEFQSLTKNKGGKTWIGKGKKRLCISGKLGPEWA